MCVYDVEKRGIKEMGRGLFVCDNERKKGRKMKRREGKQGGCAYPGGRRKKRKRDRVTRVIMWVGGKR